MPIYEYVCDDCGAHYERIVMNGNTKSTCPRCSSAKGTIQLSVFAMHGSAAKSGSGSTVSAKPGAPTGGCCGGACGCRN